MTDYRNSFEKLARTRKVRALCGAVRILGRQIDAEPWQLSHWIGRAGDDVRASVIQLAGVIAPSDATWTRVIRALRVYQEVA